MPAHARYLLNSTICSSVLRIRSYSCIINIIFTKFVCRPSSITNKMITGRKGDRLQNRGIAGHFAINNGIAPLYIHMYEGTERYKLGLLKNCSITPTKQILDPVTISQLTQTARLYRGSFNYEGSRCFRLFIKIASPKSR